MIVTGQPLEQENGRRGTAYLLGEVASALWASGC